jgi:hypothetical protein
MPVTLEQCLLHILELERRIERLELAVSRTGQIAPPAPQRRHVPETAVVSVKPDAVFPVLRFEDEQKAVRSVQKVETSAALEAYPRVLDRIRMLWFYPECEQLLDKLIIDDRGNSSGFNRDIMDELLFLARLSRAVKMTQDLSVKSMRPEKQDVWADQRMGRHA